MNIREPVVAGQFYPATAKKLRSELDGIYSREKSRIQTSLSSKGIIGGVVPHAGYVFSAGHAMHFFDILKQSHKKTDTFLIANPNHTGLGDPVSLDEHDAWHSPLGDVEIDKDFAQHLGYPANSAAHNREHAGEVMLPLLQYFMEDEFRIVPVSMGDQSYRTAHALAEKALEAAKNLGRRVTVIASSDFSHFESKETGRRHDDKVLEKIEQLDTPGVEEVVARNRISVCGYGPIMTLDRKSVV